MFMRFTKFSTDCSEASASTVMASFALPIITDLSSSSTVILSPALSHTTEPLVPVTESDAVSSLSSVYFPVSMSSAMTYSAMSLLRYPTFSFSPPFCSSSTVSVLGSISTYALTPLSSASSAQVLIGILNSKNISSRINVAVLFISSPLHYSMVQSSGLCPMRMQQKGRPFPTVLIIFLL